MNKKGFTAPIIILGSVILISIVAGAFYFFKVKTPSQKACTMDAKICPDGSSVGRSGPNCEFSPCPSSKATPDETANPDSIGANWKTSCKNIIDDPKTKYKECEMTGKYNSSEDEKSCKEIGGQYISCSSPCRHDPLGTMCAAVCVPLCTFQ